MTDVVCGRTHTIAISCKRMGGGGLETGRFVTFMTDPPPPPSSGAAGVGMGGEPIWSTWPRYFRRLLFPARGCRPFGSKRHSRRRRRLPLARPHWHPPPIPNLTRTDRGTVYAWGYNSNGQLGVADTSPQPLPAVVTRTDPGVFFVSSVAAGAYHSVFVTGGGGERGGLTRGDAGDIYCAGSNRNGQLGNGAVDFNSHPTPTRVSSIDKQRGMVIYTGGYHNLAVTGGGVVRGD
jgi:hypothetical protein